MSPKDVSYDRSDELTIEFEAKIENILSIVGKNALESNKIYVYISNSI